VRSDEVLKQHPAWLKHK